jgi:Kelch motif protein
VRPLALGLLCMLLAGCAAPGLPGPTSGVPQAQALAWASHAPGPTPRSEVAVGVLDAEFYVVGGFTADGTTSTRVEAYDAATDTWRRAPDYPLDVHHTTVIGDAGTLYVFGGAITPGFLPTPLAFKLDPAAPAGPAWLPLPPLPHARFAHAGAALDGKVYLVGGFGADRGGLQDVDVFDLATQTWSTAPPLPTWRDHLAAAVFDGRIVAIGGDQGSHDTDLTVVEALTPGANQWETLAPLPLPKGAMAAAVWRGALVVAGGEDNNRTFPDVFALPSATANWTILPPLPTPRHGFGAAVWGDRFYVLLGGPQPGLSVTASVESLGSASDVRGVVVQTFAPGDSAAALPTEPPTARPPLR